MVESFVGIMYVALVVSRLISMTVVASGRSTRPR
jgi:hypothetical protein